MKIISRILSLLIIATLALFYTGCKGKTDDPSPEKVQLGKLSKTWNLTLASVDDTPRLDFTGVTLTLSGDYSENGTYQYDVKGTVPNPSPWDDAGYWSFGANPSTDMIREPATDKLAMNYSIVGSTLTITFNLATDAAGWEGGVYLRTSQVSGSWRFEFTAAN